MATAMSSPPEPIEQRDAWRDALDQYLARRERIRTLRLELAAARGAGKQRRHDHRLRRDRAGDTTTQGETA